MWLCQQDRLLLLSHSELALVTHTCASTHQLRTQGESPHQGLLLLLLPSCVATS